MPRSETPLRSDLFPEISPYASGMLAVDGRHTIYWEQSGNPEGLPVVFLHGGPGAGSAPVHRRFFDPQFYRIVVFDQRGCGRSMPLGELQDNTTADLVADMEKLRAHLGIPSWLLFGGSWGQHAGAGLWPQPPWPGDRLHPARHLPGRAPGDRLVSPRHAHHLPGSVARVRRAPSGR